MKEIAHFAVDRRFGSEEKQGQDVFIAYVCMCVGVVD